MASAPDAHKELRSEAERRRVPLDDQTCKLFHSTRYWAPALPAQANISSERLFFNGRGKAVEAAWGTEVAVVPFCLSRRHVLYCACRCGVHRHLGGVALQPRFACLTATKESSCFPGERVISLSGRTSQPLSPQAAHRAERSLSRLGRSRVLAKLGGQGFFRLRNRDANLARAMLLPATMKQPPRALVDRTRWFGLVRWLRLWQWQGQQQEQQQQQANLSSASEAQPTCLLAR